MMGEKRRTFFRVANDAAQKYGRKKGASLYLYVRANFSMMHGIHGLVTRVYILSLTLLHETEAETDEHKLARKEGLIFTVWRSACYWSFPLAVLDPWYSGTARKKGGGEDIKGVHDETKGRDKGPYVEELLNEKR